MNSGSASNRIVLFGCGGWGQNLARVLHQMGVLAAIVDPSAEGRCNAARVAPGVPCVGDLKAAADADFSGVVIATPAETHAALAERMLLAGKDVFVEKPLALHPEQGARLLRLADDHGRILMVGHVLEYHPAIVRLGELVAAGELGRLQYIYSHRLSLGKIRREENILWSFAPHDIAVILRLVGAMPFQVAACGGSYIRPNIADATVTHLLFDNGVRAHVHVSWLHPFKEQRLVVIGSRKMASFDDVAKKLVLYDQRVEWQGGDSVPVRGTGEEVPFAAHEPLRLECEAFLSSVASRVPPLTDGASALRVLKVLQAAQRSLVTNGHPVDLPLEIA
ncbi:MAG: Gfo/Idh/MocA family oxidoreductase [Limisphaerales bacterium]